MSARRFLAPVLLAIAIAPGSSHADTSLAVPLLTWLAADGAPLWSLRLEPPKSDVPLAPLSTSPRFPSLPQFEVELLEGGTMKKEDLAGSVILLDFWASWCAPCLQELPHLQKLYEQERGNGLAAVAVNADEPLALVKRTVAQLGLTMPVGIYEDSLRETFGIRTLPTLVVADRRGRIRGRWDGYAKGLEKTIAERVRELLGDDPEGSAREIAKVVDGVGAFDIAWAIELQGPVSGLAALGSSRADAVSALAAAGDQLVLLDAAGSALRRLKLPSSTWRLAAPPTSTRDAAPDVLAFRLGAGDLLSIDLDQGMMRGWSAPGPVFGLAFSVRDAGEDSAVWIATLEGLGLADLAGGEVARIGEPAAFVGVATGPAGGVVALARDGVIRRLDAAGGPGSGIASPKGSRQLVVAPGLAGVGVAPESVAAIAIGAFLGGVARQAAIANYEGDLAIADLESGEVLFRARWPGIAALAAGDLDGDGRDEILVGAGRTVAVLRARVPDASGGK